MRARRSPQACHNEADRCTALPFQDTSLGPAPKIMITGERPNGLAACISCEYRCAIGLAECVAGFRFPSHLTGSPAVLFRCFTSRPSVAVVANIHIEPKVASDELWCYDAITYQLPVQTFAHSNNH